MINKRNIVCVFIIAAALAAIFTIAMEYSNTVVRDVPAVTEKIESIIPPRTKGTDEKRYGSDMPMMNIDGNDYIGIIEVPSRNVKLPVYSNWDEKAVRSVPCRYSGSVYDLTLIIGGTGMNGGFDFLTTLEKGEKVIFTDMTGREYDFKVDSVFHRQNFDLNDDGGLFLFSYMDDVSKYIFVKCR